MCQRKDQENGRKKLRPSLAKNSETVQHLCRTFLLEVHRNDNTKTVSRCRSN